MLSYCFQSCLSCSSFAENRINKKSMQFLYAQFLISHQFLSVIEWCIGIYHAFDLIQSKYCSNTIGYTGKRTIKHSSWKLKFFDLILALCTAFLIAVTRAFVPKPTLIQDKLLFVDLAKPLIFCWASFTSLVKLLCLYNFINFSLLQISRYNLTLLNLVCKNLTLCVNGNLIA